MKNVLRKKIIIPILACVVFFTTTAFKNDFFEIAKQIEIFTTLFKELNMNYVDETNPAELMDTAIKNMLDDLDANLVLMEWDGRSDEEMVEYAMEYTPHTEAQIRRTIQSQKSPLRQIYAFTYSQAKMLMRPLLQNSNQKQVFRRFLTEPVYPSLLIEWARKLNEKYIPANPSCS